MTTFTYRIRHVKLASMSLRHAVLGLLASKPSNGYELTQRFDDTLSHSWHASHSQIYPELAKLEEAGLIEVVGEGPRRSRTFAATQEGRDEIRRWLLETEPDRAQRSETGVRWFLLFLLEPEDRRAVLAKELSDLDAHLVMMHAREAEVPATGRFRPVLEMAIRTQTVMRDWLREQLAALD
jgi:PadR family transcriptional regulator, regulatory protein AphA